MSRWHDRRWHSRFRLSHRTFQHNGCRLAHMPGGQSRTRASCASGNGRLLRILRSNRAECEPGRHSGCLFGAGSWLYPGRQRGYLSSPGYSLPSGCSEWIPLKVVGSCFVPLSFVRGSKSDVTRQVFPTLKRQDTLHYDTLELEQERTDRP